MVRRTVWLAALLAGCELAPSDPTLSTLFTVQGTLENPEGLAAETDVILTWYLFTFSAEEETSWLSTERQRVTDNRFVFNLVTLPPDTAVFSAGEADVEVAVGFLSLSDANAAPDFNCSARGS